MDPWVNSLVQSPLVRSLNTVPARISSFAHGVRDNVPPFSYSKVVVQPYQTSTTVPDFTHKFRVPQFGLLDRAYLRLRMNTKYSSDTTSPYDGRLPWVNKTTNGSQGTSAAASSSWNYADALTQVSLQTHNKIIETIPAECIAAEVMKLPDGERRFFEKGMNGFAAGAGSPGDATLVYGTARASYSAPAANDRHDYYALWDPSIGTVDTTDAAVLAGTNPRLIVDYHNHADFIIPLPFDTMKQLKDNFQTRFVEDLEIHVGTKNYKRGIMSIEAGKSTTTPTVVSALTGTDHYVPELVLIYHNFHDTIENAVRDQNYKRGFPASVYSHDWLEEAVVLSKSNQYRVDFRSNNLINEIIIVRQLTRSNWGANAANEPTQATGTYAISGYNLVGTGTDAGRSTLAKCGGMIQCPYIPSYKLTLTGSGREIWSAFDHELCGPDSADYELADGHPYGGDHANGSIAGDQQCHPIDCVFGAETRPLIGGNLLGFGRNLRVMRFGFQGSSNFYTGGIAFQTLSNPTLILDSGNGKDWLDHTFRVYVRYSTMMRIDSDTGVITRTLDV